MARQTIDFGIDLGTTNSAIAVLGGTSATIIKAAGNEEVTPSAVWLNPRGELVVGTVAKNQSLKDPSNAFTEFKLSMGTDRKYIFARNSRAMRAEELSAEVLKTLINNVKPKLGEDVSAAVITVPAAFELHQVDATRRAGELAGLKLCPLLQEPVAASMAYGFQSGADKATWMVFDLGGGTFDAALMRVRDGLIRVHHHGGDPYLGGKIIDWAIVEEIFIPALLQGHSLSDFRRGCPKWNAAMAKLKGEAEQAKIRLSADGSYYVSIDYLCDDDDGRPVEFQCELQRSDLEPLAVPVFAKAIGICRQVLREKRVSPAQVEKIILVGGPTMTPLLREMLVSSTEHSLGIPIEFRLNPLTVVAEGAAIVGGTHVVSTHVSAPLLPGTFAIDFKDWRSVVDSTEFPAAGKISAPGATTLAGFSIFFVNERSGDQSERIPVPPDGTFLTTLRAHKGQVNVFIVSLCDASGRLVPVMPDRKTCTIGMAVSGQSLINSIGYERVDGSVFVILEKGASLPVRKRFKAYQATPVRHGDRESWIKIPIVEGESPHAGQNGLIGRFAVPGTEIPRDLPAGSEMEVTLCIDESRIPKVQVYVPFLDSDFEARFEYDQRPGELPNELKIRLEGERRSVAELNTQAITAPDNKGAHLLAEIDRTKPLEEIEAVLRNADADPQEATRCLRLLQQLGAKLREAEKALEWPTLVTEAQDAIEALETLVEKSGEQADRATLGMLRRELDAALTAHDAIMVRQKVSLLWRLHGSVAGRAPEYWLGCLEYLNDNRHSMTDQKAVESYFRQAQIATQNQDLDGLRSACRQLLALLPPAARKASYGYGSTVD